MECFGPTTVCLPVLFIRQHEIIAFVYSGYLFLLRVCFFYGKRSRKSALDGHKESVIALQPTVLLSSIIWHQAGLMSEWAGKEAEDLPPVRARHRNLCGLLAR